MSDHRDGRTDAELEAMLRDLTAEEIELLEPPDGIWDRIEAAASAEEDPDPAATVVPLASRRRLPRPLAIGIAAALVLVVAGVAALLLARDDSGEVVATAVLAYDSENFDSLGARAEAGADLVADAGSHSIVIVDAALPSPEAGADLEVWLIRPDADGNVADLVSLGVVDPAGPETLDVPAGYDPGAYFVVDISVEPRDGDAGHSGRSILRGPLRDV